MFFRPKSRNKLNAQKIKYDGIEFDSMSECYRYQDLKILQMRGEIADLELQVVYDLIPDHYAMVETGEVYKRGSKKGQPKTKRVCIEQGVKYIADFKYTITKTGETVVEDVKGYRDTSAATYKVFVLKRKLMLHIYGIRVVEITGGRGRK